MANIYLIPLLIIFTIGFGIYSSTLGLFNIYLYFNTVFLILGMIYGTFFLSPYFPKLSGRIMVLCFTILVVIIVIVFDFVIFRDIFLIIWNIIASVLVGLLLFEDIRGFTPVHKSEVGEKLWKKGKKKMKFLTASFKLNPYGQIKLIEEECIGCEICTDVCPMNIYQFEEKKHIVMIQNGSNCINCNACVKRCPVNCLSIV